eukprot:TRINITY_DN2829_c0_g2_i2.p1 TRINITY_DN2829_c0_g2~~TRINITY_DN2829_c0_g2_i2.p1  ORF type:complete len:220 (-),score=35.94 TRINITY_DN2829_c0_g2_i2:123-746(-)
MAVNPQLQPSGVPVPFWNEAFVLCRQGIELQLEGFPLVPNGKWTSKGMLFLSNIRMVFVPSSPHPPISAFDMPLLFVEKEAFNQPIFACNNLSGIVRPVAQGQVSASPYAFKILFKEGGVGTFLPLFFNILHMLRSMATTATPTAPVVSPASAPPAAQIANPLPEEAPPVEAVVRHAFVDPSDPSTLYLEQPRECEGAVRRRHYAST